MNRDEVASTDWTGGVLLGAVLGGICWGIFGTTVVGPHHVNSYLLGAVAVSALLLMVAVTLTRTKRTLAVALVVALVSGWIILGLVYLQMLVLR